MKLLMPALMLIFCFFLNAAYAQKIEDGYYFFDKDWKPAKEKKAAYLLKVNAIGDSCKQFSYYHILGPLIRIETFRVDQTTVRQGFSAWYNKSGRMDSCGHYDHGLADKLWLYLDSKGLISRSRDYDHGVFVKETDLAAERKEAVAKASKDSANLVKRVESESEFPGGAQGWLQYLMHNQRFPDRAVNNNIQGEVRLYFVVDTTGKIMDHPVLLKSVEVSLDEQALSVISNSPDWIPASQNGRKVKSYKTQPLWYKLETGNSR